MIQKFFLTVKKFNIGPKTKMKNKAILFLNYHYSENVFVSVYGLWHFKCLLSLSLSLSAKDDEIIIYSFVYLSLLFIIIHQSSFNNYRKAARKIQIRNFEL